MSTARRLVPSLLLASLASLSTVAAIAAQAPAGKAEENFASPAGSAVQLRTAASPAEALFVEKCSMCHRQRGMGTVILARRMDAAKAQLEKREDLTAPFITAVVRTGAGNMPRITRGEVSDEQLAVIIGYLTHKAAP